jgi:hypothetical protein
MYGPNNYMIFRTYLEGQISLGIMPTDVNGALVRVLASFRGTQPGSRHRFQLIDDLRMWTGEQNLEPSRSGGTQRSLEGS